MHTGGVAVGDAVGVGTGVCVPGSAGIVGVVVMLVPGGGVPGGTVGVVVMLVPGGGVPVGRAKAVRVSVR
jgi:hypothetical protein